jgi:hypothetical protein
MTSTFLNNNQSPPGYLVIFIKLVRKYIKIQIEKISFQIDKYLLYFVRYDEGVDDYSCVVYQDK